MVAEPQHAPWRHRIVRANGDIEYCIDWPQRPNEYMCARWSQGGRVDVYPAAWPGQWILVARKP